LPPSPLSARSFFRDPARYVAKRDGEEKVVHMAAGRGRYVLVRDPETIWRVLVSDGSSFVQGKWKRRARRFLGETLNTLDGTAHRTRRRALQPSLARSRVERFLPDVVARVERAQDGWRDGERFELRSELDPLALTIAGDVLLSTDLEPEAGDLAEALGRVMTGVPRLTPPVTGTRSRRALSRVDETVARVIREHPGSGDDLVGRLLESELPGATVRGEVIAFLLAAVDEPPSALEAAWDLLGRHPAAEERLHAELDAVLGDRTPEPGDAARLPYLDAVLRETLRLFPPARHIDRCPVADVEIGSERLPAGANVLVSPLVTHRETHLHDRADDFEPERWLEPRPPGHQRGAYVPFGAGAHTCIGEPLARAVMTFALAGIGRRWRMRVAPDAVPPGPRAPRLAVTLARR
jgi:pentalenene oxygenase